MSDYRLHPITWKNVIDYNWLRLQITITPCLVHCLLHSFQHLSTIFFDTTVSEHLQFCIQEIQHLQKEHSHAVSQWSEHFFLFSNIFMSDEPIPSNKKCFKQLIRWQCSFTRVTADFKYSRSLHLQWCFLSLRHLSHGIETLLA